VTRISVNVTIDDWVLEAVDEVIANRSSYRESARNRSQLIQQLLEGHLEEIGYEYEDDDDDDDDE